MRSNAAHVRRAFLPGYSAASFAAAARSNFPRRAQRMRFRSIAVAMVSIVGARAVQAQAAAADPSCKGATGDACQQAVDFFHYLAPQLGTAMTGGNTTLGQGGNLGGFRFGFVPRVVVGARVNIVMGDIPKFNPAPQNPLLPNAPPPRATTTPLVTDNGYVPL